MTCNGPNEAYPSDPIDCDDTDPNRNSSENEVIGDGIDQDCDFKDDCYEDLDGDTFGDTAVVVASVRRHLLAGQQRGDGGGGTATTATPIASRATPRSPGTTSIRTATSARSCYEDNDNDGARHPTDTFTTSFGDTDCTDPGEGEATDPEDCDDDDPLVGPGSNEVVGNNVDEDCDGTVQCWQDADNDGARSDTFTLTTVPGDTDCTGAFEGRTADPIDCDESDPNVNPDANEITGNNVDDDCDGIENCFLDNDDDGARSTTVDAGGVDNDDNCNDPREGLSADPLDCNDTDAAIHPGANEIAGDNVDQDCSNTELCYFDVDNDGARTNATFETGLLDTNCTQANEGELTDPIDCDDNDVTILPGAIEGRGDEVDQNCDGDELCYLDGDNDGDRHATDTILSVGNVNCTQANEGRASDPIDCDDTDATRASGNVETPGNEVDNDCDLQEECYVDADNDGDRHLTLTVTSPNTSCGQAGEARFDQPIDCNDNDATQFNGAPELCDGLDNDCNSAVPGDEIDDDGDGHVECTFDPNGWMETARSLGIGTAMTVAP